MHSVDKMSGMSRAAKKRAKKRQKKKQSMASQSDSPQSKKAKPSDCENLLVQEATEEIVDDRSDDEIVDMKSGTEEPEVVTLPKDCASLLQVLSEQEYDFTSRQRAHCALEFLLQPSGVSVAHFYDSYWEKKPLLAQHAKQGASKEHRQRFDGLMSLESIRSIVQSESVLYGRDLNLTKYKHDSQGVQRRVTLDKVGERVVSKELWSKFDSGCTIRLLCPHKYSTNTHTLMSTLEHEWGCMVGANAYLTPPNHSQGFAPHYDAIEAFCLQLEGTKHWKVYKPLNKGETLPRVSSEDYTEADLSEVKPVMDVVLEPGDLLYMPRGWIHQACTDTGGEHSLHLTVSCMQQWAWADLLEILLPGALEATIDSENSTSLREGLPPRFLDYMGSIHEDNLDGLPDTMKKAAEEEINTEKRVHQENFRSEAKKRIMRVTKEALGMIDAACDQLGKRFTSDRLPPALTPNEKETTSESMKTKFQLLPHHLCRLVRPGMARLVLEDDKAVVYHCGDNSLVYHENPVSPLEFEMDDGPALEQLLTTNPQYICVADLIHDSIEDKIGVAQALWDEGIIALYSADAPDM